MVTGALAEDKTGAVGGRVHAGGGAQGGDTEAASKAEVLEIRVLALAAHVG